MSLEGLKMDKGKFIVSGVAWRRLSQVREVDGEI